jgi:hypothetical protein
VEFGIYILTYPGDFYLSLPLIRSLRFFHPDIPIMIIPGEGLDVDRHPFDIPVMAIPDGYWAKIRHSDRKFWAFQGPFEKFLYLDADIICTRSLNCLIDRINEQDDGFIFVQMSIDDYEWRAAVVDRNHEKHELCINRVAEQLGNPEKLRSFDSSYNPYCHYAFNAGIFASSRLAIGENDFKALYEKEFNFFAQRLGKNFTWRDYDLFFGDQGRLNYLVEKLDITILNLFPDGHYMWGGMPKTVSFVGVCKGEVDFSFIHWAGCPRPSPSFFCGKPLLRLLATTNPKLGLGYQGLSEIPGYSLWYHFYTQNGKTIGLVEKLLYSYRDLKKITRCYLGRLKRTVRKGLSFSL